MKINNNQQFNKNFNVKAQSPAFGGKRLLSLGIKTARKGWDCGEGKCDRFKPEKCFFTEMNETDIDFAYLERELVEPSAYGSTIIRNFLDKISGYTPPSRYSNMRFFMLEPDILPGVQDSARAYAQIREFADCVEVDYLQSASEYDIAKRVKGAGKAMMYGLVRLVKEWKKDFLCLTASKPAVKWYERLGLERGDNTEFFLYAKNYDKFIENLEKKITVTNPDFLNKTTSSRLEPLPKLRPFLAYEDKK